MILGLLSLALMVTAKPDPQAMAVLQQHGWLDQGQATEYTQEEIQRLDPWAEASWWSADQPKAPSRPIWGLLWDENDRLQQILPRSALDQAGITEENLAGIVDPNGVVQPVSRRFLGDREGVTWVLRGGVRRLVRKSIWQPPTLWRAEDGRLRAYFLDREVGAIWQRWAVSSSHHILDLRGCRGGYTETALEILGTFLGPDRIVAAYRSLDEFGRLRRSSLRTSSAATKILEPTEWTVLVDRHTASAGELLAMGLERYGSRLVGKPMFGKHTTQDQTTLPDGGWIRFTVGEFGE